MKDRIESLHVLRGIACLIVVIAHIFSTSPKYGNYMSGCGKIGVWCFMLLSGFFLMKSINSADKFNIIKFYKKKLLRIYPTYIVVLIISALIKYISWTSVVKHIFIIEGYGHFWYMPVIVEMYLVWPVFAYIFLIIKKIGNENIRNITWIGLLGACGIIVALAFPYTNYVENSTALYWYMPVFILGMIMAYIYNNFDMKTTTTFDICGLIGLICIIVSTPYMREKIWGIEPYNWLQNKYLLISIFWIFIMLSALYGNHIKAALERFKLSKIIAENSFFIYLIHYVILAELCRYTENMALRLLLTILLTVLATFCLRLLSKYLSDCIKKLKIFRSVI